MEELIVCIWLTVREQEKKKMTLFLNLHNWDGDDTIRRNRKIIEWISEENKLLERVGHLVEISSG